MSETNPYEAPQKSEPEAEDRKPYTKVLVTLAQVAVGGGIAGGFTSAGIFVWTSTVRTEIGLAIVLLLLAGGVVVGFFVLRILGLGPK